MTSMNLSIVFGPNSISREGADPFDTSGYEDVYSVFACFIDHYDEIFSDVEKERENLKLLQEQNQKNFSNFDTGLSSSSGNISFLQPESPPSLPSRPSPKKVPTGSTNPMSRSSHNILLPSPIPRNPTPLKKKTASKKPLPKKGSENSLDFMLSPEESPPTIPEDGEQTGGRGSRKKEMRGGRYSKIYLIFNFQ